MAHDPQTLVQRQVVLRVLPEDLQDEVRASTTGGYIDDIHIFREEDQPSPMFYPASNERMTFQLRGNKYPASLIDLPCPVETHRTFDRVTTYKSSDVAQILIVYEDEEARDRAEAEARPRKEGDLFLGHPSGLTPPTHNVTRQRFAKTKGKLESFARTEVEAVEQELMAFFETTSSRASAAAASAATLVVGDAELPAGSVIICDEEEVVDFEEYMWSASRPGGVTVREDEPLGLQHPQIFLKPPPPQPRNAGGRAAPPRSQLPPASAATAAPLPQQPQQPQQQQQPPQSSGGPRVPPKFAGAPARRKDTSTPPGGRKVKPPSITETDMLNADTEQLSSLLEFDLFSDNTEGGGTEDHFSNLEDDMAILDGSSDPFADVTDLPPQASDANQRTSPPPPSPQPPSQPSRPPTPQKTATKDAAAAAESAEGGAQAPVAGDTGDASTQQELSEASTRALSEDTELQNLLEGAQRAASEEASAQQKVAALRSKMAAAPNPVMKMRFTSQVKDAETALARATEAKDAADAAGDARREHVLSLNK